MAVYSPKSLGIKPPVGGFETGGFYRGREYWGGTLSEPGQIHPQSDRPGAGGEAYVAPKDVAYIESQRKIKARPTTEDQITPYLNKFQGDIFKASEAPKVKVPTMEEARTATAPTVGLPDPLDRVAKYEELRTEHGVAALETNLNQIKADIEEEYALFREARGIEEGKPVAMGVISGRISEQEKTAQERIDFLGRQQNRIVDELNTKYNVISQYMQFYGLDYTDAVDRYDKEYTRNIEMYKTILGQESKVLDQWNADRAAASSNLTMYMNAVTAGSIDYNSLSADQKLQITKLEVQAGLPAGFMSTIKKDVDADIVFQTSVSGITQIGFRNPDGTITVKKYGEKVTGTGDDDMTTQDYRDALVEDIKDSKNLDNVMTFYINNTNIAPRDILRLYDLNSPFGAHKESEEELEEKYGVKF